MHRAGRRAAEPLLGFCAASSCQMVERERERGREREGGREGDESAFAVEAGRAKNKRASPPHSVYLSVASPASSTSHFHSGPPRLGENERPSLMAAGSGHSVLQSGFRRPPVKGATKADIAVRRRGLHPLPPPWTNTFHYRDRVLQICVLFEDLDISRK